MTTNISDAMSRKKEPMQFEYHWRVELPLISGFDMKALNHRVHATDLPNFSFDVRRFSHGNGFLKAPNHLDYPALSLKIDEYEDQLTIQYINAWRDLIKDTDGGLFPPANYKKDIIFITLDEGKEDNSSLLVRGCWPSEVSPISWSYDGSSIVQYTVTFPVDFIKYL